MTVRRLSRLTVLTGALLVLLPAVAVLQYRWVGQVSEAERERMRRNLVHAARQFRETLDGEVGRAFMSLHVDAAVARDEAWARYAERYAAWAGTTANPALVAHVFLIDAVDNVGRALRARPMGPTGPAPQIRLRRWNTQTHAVEMTDWDEPLAASRAHFEQELAAFSAGRQGERAERPPFRDEESLLVAPLVSVQIGRPAAHVVQHTPLVMVFGFTVVQLNMGFIREQLLPALAERHFTETDGAAYRAAVVDAENPRRLIYRSSPDAPTDASAADVTEALFVPHPDPLMFIARGAIGRAVHETRRNFIVSVIRKGEDSAVRTRILDESAGRWRLLIQHQSGSLEAAVAGVRQRNLLISFGILLLMCVSMGLLALSSRRAQELARQQMEFVAGVSHELRTPVAVIRSAAENLSHGVVGDPQRVRRYGDTIQAEARRLGEMVERVLQFAAIESGRPVAGTLVAVEPLIEEAVDASGSVHAASGFAGEATVERHIAADLPPVLGDADALRSAIQNLIANALKYGGADRWVGIRVDSSPAGRPREVHIAVEDHGPGIAAGDLPRIFDPFYRGADVAGRQIQGSGLGLALVKRTVHAHGGRVTVTSREGAGSTFTIHLPAAQPSPAGAQDGAVTADAQAAAHP